MCKDWAQAGFVSTSYKPLKHFTNLKCTVLPNDRTILLEETLKGTTSRATIQPNSDLIFAQLILSREKPKEQLSALALLRANRHQT
jgi:hypothetical protein